MLLFAAMRIVTVSLIILRLNMCQALFHLGVVDLFRLALGLDVALVGDKGFDTLVCLQALAHCFQQCQFLYFLLGKGEETLDALWQHFLIVLLL